MFSFVKVLFIPLLVSSMIIIPVTSAEASEKVMGYVTEGLLWAFMSPAILGAGLLGIASESLVFPVRIHNTIQYREPKGFQLVTEGTEEVSFDSKTGPITAVKLIRPALRKGKENYYFAKRSDESLSANDVNFRILAKICYRYCVEYGSNNCKNLEHTYGPNGGSRHIILPIERSEIFVPRYESESPLFMFPLYLKQEEILIDFKSDGDEAIVESITCGLHR